MHSPQKCAMQFVLGVSTKGSKSHEAELSSALCPCVCMSMCQYVCVCVSVAKKSWVEAPFAPSCLPAFFQYSRTLVSVGLWFQGDHPRRKTMNARNAQSSALCCGCLIHFSLSTVQFLLKTCCLSTNLNLSLYHLS
jgi:hypothetical protein